MLNIREIPIFVKMRQQAYIKKLTIAALFVFAVQVVFASFITTGNTNNKKNASKYSLKNLSQYSKKGLSLSSIRLNSKLTATELNASNTANSVQMTNGNTTFIYPYKSKVKVPKFKAPTPTSF